MTHTLANNPHPVIIPSQNIHLDGILYTPSGAQSIVLFAHGSGSSRFSKRNQFVASVLNAANHATLLFDLFTPEEEIQDKNKRELLFDMDFLASRLVDATDWCTRQPETKDLSIGYFGASTGGGAAIVAAAKESHLIKTVISRGGRPDLAGDALPLVKAPTLFIVGGDDETVLELNKFALSKMQCVKKLEIVPGATHLFDEPGTLEEVARLATLWFTQYL